MMQDCDVGDTYLVDIVRDSLECAMYFVMKRHGGRIYGCQIVSAQRPTVPRRLVVGRVYER